MCQSKDKQARIQQIIQGLSITCTRKEIGKVQNMGKINICTMQNQKDVVQEHPIDRKVH